MYNIGEVVKIRILKGLHQWIRLKIEGKCQGKCLDVRQILNIRGVAIK